MLHTLTDTLRCSLRLANLHQTPTPESVPHTPAQTGRRRCPHRSRASPASLLQSGDVSSIPSARLCVTCLGPSSPSIYHPRSSGPRGRGTPGPAGHQRSSPQALNYVSDTQKETTEKHQRIQGKQPRGERLKVPETEGTENRAQTEEPSLLGAPPELSRGGCADGPMRQVSVNQRKTSAEPLRVRKAPVPSSTHHTGHGQNPPCTVSAQSYRHPRAEKSLAPTHHEPPGEPAAPALGPKTQVAPPTLGSQMDADTSGSCSRLCFSRWRR